MVIFMPRGNTIPREGPEDTLPTQIGSITISGAGVFTFNATEIKPVREDIFQPGHFSIFAILVHLNDLGEIDLSYHFEEPLNTYIIDELNGEPYWWYTAYYTGGWTERSIFRMDHYPYKDGMYIAINPSDASTLESYYTVYRVQGIRKRGNNNQTIIPTVTLTKYSNSLVFENVTITPHNLRIDTFQPGVITAIDVILSLGDQDKITYSLQWYEQIGTASIVKSYWVQSINNWKASGRCGFVYETGPEHFSGGRGNHIHIPSDFRAINSPEYLLYYWIELGPC